MPVSAPPTGLDECLFFISLVSDFLVVRFSVSSGCARRRSVSTYAAILVLSGSLNKHFFKKDVEMANKYMKTFLIPLVPREMQIKS